MIKFIKILLSPVVIVYSVIIRLRNWFFDTDIFKSERVCVKVISIGNLTVGGSGKTPTVVATTRMLKDAGKRVGILSRGYGRNSKGYILVSKGDGNIVSVDKCGDEMYLATDECQVPSAVSERRLPGAKRFINEVDLDAIVLDDAFQHRWLKRDLDVVICDQRFLLKAGQIDQNLLPLGLMREPFSSLTRANVVIVNRKFSDKKELPDKIKEFLKDKNVFHGYYEATGIYDLKTHHRFDIEEFQGQHSLVVCGIARPYSFLRILEKNSIDIKNKLIFQDHKDYTSKEVREIRKEFYDSNSFSVLTTQKDAVKLTNFSRDLDDIDIYYLKIELKLENEKSYINELLNIFNN